MTAAVIYVRASLDVSGEALAVSRQEEECRRIAQQLGRRVSKVYADNSISASRREIDRPAYNQMLADYAAGAFNMLLCWDLDRLTRQPSQLEQWIDLAEQKGLRIVTANGEADLGTDGGRMYARIKAAVARAEVERKGARQRAANKQRALSGLPYGRKQVWGWLDLLCTTLDETVAELIRKASADILAGASVTEITARWNQTEVRAPGGKLWLPATVRATLLRPMNAGIVTYRGVEYRDVEPKWAPIVGRDTFDALKAELASRGNFKHGSGVVSSPRKYLMGGILRCGKCGSTMQGANQRSGINYVCSGKAEGCYRSIRVEKADRFVLRWVALNLILMDPSDHLPATSIERLHAIGGRLRQVRDERQEATKAAISASSKVAWLTSLDAQERALQVEAAGLTRDSAIASLQSELVIGGDAGDVDADSALMDAQIRRVVDRLRALSQRQQRLLIQEAGSYEVLGRDVGQRVRVS